MLCCWDRLKPSKMEESHDSNFDNVSPDLSLYSKHLNEDENIESEEEEEEETDSLEEARSQLSKLYLLKGNRCSVSAEAYGKFNKKQAYIPKVFPKTEDQKSGIRRAITECFLFNALEPEDIDIIIDAFEEKKVEKGVRIIEQGDDGEQLYLIESGEASVYKVTPPSKEAVLVQRLFVGDVFGELALLYSAPRAASVVADTDMDLWALGRLTFNCIVRDAAAQKREIYEELLKDVELLKELNSYERAQIADALTPRTFTAGETIIKEGDPGDRFYILVSGEAEAIKGDKALLSYKAGNYFGELALLKDQPRAATVVAKSTPCKVVSIGRKSFKRLLGPVEAILVRNMDIYMSTLKKLGIDTGCLEP